MIMVGSEKSLMTGGRPNNPKLLVYESGLILKTINHTKNPKIKMGDETPVLSGLMLLKTIINHYQISIMELI